MSGVTDRPLFLGSHECGRNRNRAATTTEKAANTAPAIATTEYPTHPLPDSEEMNKESSERTIQMVDDPLEGLQRPVARARNETSLLAGSAPAHYQGGTSSSSPPLIDATKIVPLSLVGADPSKRQRSFTRIEGMEALEKPIIDESNNPELSEAEKRMKEEELSFYSASDNDHGDDNIWGLLSGVGGNIYEWYVRVPWLQCDDC